MDAITDAFLISEVVLTDCSGIDMMLLPKYA